MINIIISESSGRFKTLYGEAQAPVASFIEEAAKADKASCLALKIFSEKSSNSHSEAYGGLTAADEMQPVGEGALAPLNSFTERASKSLTNEVWKSEIRITREMIADCKGDMKKLIQRCGAAKLTSAYFRTIQNFCSGLIGTALLGQEKYMIGNKGFDTTCYDGKVVFAKNHTLLDGKTKQCNVYSNAFSIETLGELSTRHQNFKGEKGENLGISPDTIIIPNLFEVKQAVFAAIGSDKEPGTANNGFNYLFGQWNVIVDPSLNRFVKAGEPFPFILLDSQFNEKCDGNIFQNRDELEITSKEGTGGNNVWESYARFTAGFGEYRQMIAGGVSWGEAL